MLTVTTKMENIMVMKWSWNKLQCEFWKHVSGFILWKYLLFSMYTLRKDVNIQ